MRPKQWKSTCRVVLPVTLILAVCAIAGCANSPVADPASGYPADTSLVETAVTQYAIDNAPASVSADVPDVYSLIGYFSAGGTSETEKYGMIESSVQSCMQAAGWEYFPVDPEQIVVGEEPMSFSARLSWRQQFGFGLAPTAPDSAGNDVDLNRDYRSRLSSGAQGKYDLTLGSTESETGCAAAAVAAVQAQSRKFQVADQNVIVDTLNRLLSDPRYEAAMSDWSACMKAKGYEFSIQEQARSYFSEQYAQSPIGQVPEELLRNEIAGAVADWQCDNAHLHVVRLTVEAEIVQSMVEAGRLPSSWLLPPDIGNDAG